MLQSISSVFVVYRRKTLTGSPDPTHANSTDKPCKEPCKSTTEVNEPCSPVFKEAQPRPSRGSLLLALIESTCNTVPIVNYCNKYLYRIVSNKMDLDFYLPDKPHR